MGFQVKEPILVIGLGGVGAKLAADAKDILDSDCMIISNDIKDFESGATSVHVTTESVVNPSIQLIRGSTYKVSEEIKAKIKCYSTVVMMSNLAGKTGSAIAPVVSEICNESKAGLISFAIMPFKYEKDRIFSSGVSLKRVKEHSECTVVLDNDALLESNPSLSTRSCYNIANSAIMHVIKSLESSEIKLETSILSAGKEDQEMEDSLRDSLKMLYGSVPPSSVKSSMLYVSGGSNIPVGVLNSITSLTNGIINESQSQVDMTTDKSNMVMLSSIQGMTKFNKYDPLGVIPQEDSLDWSTPECSIDCQLDFYQLE